MLGSCFLFCTHVLLFVCYSIKQTEHNRLPDGDIKRQDPPSAGSQYNRFNPPISRYADNPVSSAQRGNPSTATWNGDRNTNTVNDLLKMSHQGFGERGT